MERPGLEEEEVILMTKFYCVKCRERKEAEVRDEITIKGKRFAIGKCGQCGTAMYRILGNA